MPQQNTDAVLITKNDSNPFDGCRGACLADVVVRYADKWYQRVVTVDGFQQRSGSDAASVKGRIAREKVLAQMWSSPAPAVTPIPRSVAAIKAQASVVSNMGKDGGDGGGGNSARRRSGGENNSPSFLMSSVRSGTGSLFISDRTVAPLQDGFKPSATLLLHQQYEADAVRSKSQCQASRLGGRRRLAVGAGGADGTMSATTTTSRSLNLQFPSLEDCKDLDSTLAGRRIERFLHKDRSASTMACTTSGGGETASSSHSNPSASRKKKLSSMGLMIQRQNSSMLRSIAKTDDDERRLLNGISLPRTSAASALRQRDMDPSLRGLPKHIKQQLLVRDEVEALQASIIRKDLESDMDLYQRTLQQEEEQLITSIPDPLKVRSDESVHTRVNNSEASSRRGAGADAGTPPPAARGGPDFLSVTNAHQLQAALRTSVVGGAVNVRRAQSAGLACSRRVVSSRAELDQAQHEAVNDAEAILAQRRREMFVAMHQSNRPAEYIQAQTRVVIDGETFIYNELFRSAQR